MTGQHDATFDGSIPQIYHDYLVPLIFEPYADDLAARTARAEPHAVLEVAAGSGVVTRAIAGVLDRKTSITATDLNPAMLERASAQQPEPERIRWEQADAQALPFGDASFDVVLCQFGAMFFPDRVQAYREARRVLKPGGVLIFNMWDRIEENEFADVVAAALAGRFPEDPPAFLARTPHGHSDTEVYEAELRMAGFDKVTVDALDEVSRADEPSHPTIAYCMGTPLRNEILERNPDGLDDATTVATDAIRDRFGSGAVSGKIRGFVIAAT